MKKIIKLTESDLEQIIKKVLNEQTFPGTSSGEGLGYREPKANINPKGLKFGMGGKYDSKNSDDVKELQSKLIKLKLLSLKNGPTGYFGNLTKIALDRYFGKNTDVVPAKPNEKKDKVSDVKPNERCIGISKQECDKISSSKETQISTGSETRCSAYMVKCLSQYDSELFGGNAWNVFNNVKNKGQVKYNAYTDGSVNWNYIYSQLSKNKIGKSICNNYANGDDTDKNVKSILPNIISSSIPNSSKININSLELGDIVGLYHSGSSNKGKAFCERAIKRNLDDNGNMEKEPFTFNSHVGFVGAIKNGTPIIIHNVHGTHMATPATKMLSKNSEDMIVWVVSDNDVASALENQNTQKSKSSFAFWN